MRYSVDGLVIRESEAGENDKRIELLTADRGRLIVTAKGARSLRSKYMNATALFTFGNYEISEREGYAWLSGASVTEAFFPIRDDIDRLALASYIIEVARELSGEGEPAPDMLRLTLNILFAIANDLKPRKLIKAVFEFRAMTMSGYCPDLSGCAVCGRTRHECMFLDVMDGEIRCADCRHSLAGRLPSEDEMPRDRVIVPLGSAMLAVARYVIDAPIEKLLSFSLDDEAIDGLATMTETFLLHHLERSFSSLDFYRNVTRMKM